MGFLKVRTCWAQIVVALFIWELSASCVSTPGARIAGQEASAPIRRQVPDQIPQPPPVTKLEELLYKTVFPTASLFAAKAIPPFMLRSTDVENNIYVEAYDNQGKLLGYLREFRGPVSTSGKCECSPLHVVLVFNANYEFTTLLAPTPLEKMGHQAMTHQEVAQLISIIQNPHPDIATIQLQSEAIDLISGATKAPFRDKVVAGAGLSTLRLLQLTRDSQQIIKGAAIAWDQQRLSQVLGQTNLTNHQRAVAIADMLPKTESAEIAHQSYRILIRSYLKALTEDQILPDENLEHRILNPHPQKLALIVGILQGCYAFADKGLRQSLVERCIGQIDNELPSNILVTQRALLRGTFFYQQGDLLNALTALELAAQEISIRRDPILHRRLTAALHTMGRSREACAHAKELFFHHPLLERVKSLLQSCAAESQSATRLIKELQEKKRASLLTTKRTSTTIVPALELENDTFNPITVDVAKDGKISVLVFFATWCPHCRKEISRLNAFAKTLERSKALKNSVQIVGIRTAIERETEFYQDFLEEFKPDFPIFTDATMSLSFAKFARTFSVPAGLPTVAVTNKKGEIRYLLPPGDYNDTARELLWAVQDILATSGENN